MKSLKKLINLVILLIVLTLAASILIGLFCAYPMYTRLEKLDDNLNRYEHTLLEVNLPLKVLENISQQFGATPNMPTKRADRLKQVYSTHLDKYRYLSNRLQATSQSNDDLISEIRQIPLVGQMPETRLMMNHMATLSHLTENLQREIRQLNTTPDQVSSMTLDLAEVRSDTLLVHLNHVSSLYHDVKRDFTMIFGTLFLIFSVFLLLAALLMAFLLNRLIGHDVHFMRSALHQLSHFDFNTTHLPETKPYFNEEFEIKQLVHGIFSEQSFLMAIKETGSQHYILDDIIDQLFKDVQSIMQTDRIGIAFVNYDTQSIIAEYGVSNYGRVMLGQGFEVHMRDTSLTSILESKLPRITENIYHELAVRPSSKSLRYLHDEGIRSNMIIPLISDNTVFGFLFFSSKSTGAYNEGTLQLGQSICHEISAMLDKTYLTKKIFSNMTRSFANLVERRDADTGNHLDRMTAYSTLIAEALMSRQKTGYTVNASFVDDVRNNAAVHDIGKVGIPDAILNKPGKLTDDEWRTMQFHSIIGADILIELQQSLKIFNRNFFQTAIDITRYHHEKWDGSGYPEGLSGETIPLSARIVAIADVFDAVTSKRVYKDAMSFDASIAMIYEGSGTHFDPYLVALFDEPGLIDGFRKIYLKDAPNAAETAPSMIS